jgi:hypothetical protein
LGYIVVAMETKLNLRTTRKRNDIELRESRLFCILESSLVGYC